MDLVSMSRHAEFMTGLTNALVWFRRDLRADDHAALAHALRAAKNVWCVFVLDRVILEPLPRKDRRVEFIRESIVELDSSLAKRGGGLIVLDGDPAHEIPRLASALGVEAVYANHDDEPYARARDDSVRRALAEARIDLRTRKDHVIFERDEILTAAGTPFTVFTPYKNAWLKRISAEDLAVQHADGPGALAPPPRGEPGVPSLAALGFERTNLLEHAAPGERAAHRLLGEFLDRIDRYGAARDYPAVDGPSRLSVHLRFGTISVRACARAAHDRMLAGSQGAATWLSELIWRDFFHQVLYHHPHVVERPFRREYDAIEWEHGERAERLLAAWREGRTGYPLVDAAMRQLDKTGYMHNRLRMVAASFLTKDLGIDWRAGERYFALKLNDYDLAANNGGWQWAASTGCDAQPYFRIFNPVAQSRKFDADGDFIRRYVPELARLSSTAIHAPWLADARELASASVVLDADYPRPVVDHDAARRRTLERYGVVKAVR
jgi:deoxyribodipyrimidine photo-lyase